jgi:hypothetical protein
LKLPTVGFAPTSRHVVVACHVLAAPPRDVLSIELRKLMLPRLAFRRNQQRPTQVLCFQEILALSKSWSISAGSRLESSASFKLLLTFFSLFRQPIPVCSSTNHRFLLRFFMHCPASATLYRFLSYSPCSQ